MRSILLFGVALLSGMLLALPVCALQNRGAGTVVTRTPSGEALVLYDRSWAVVIGIDRYQKWPSLQYAVRDAKAVRDKLMSLGFPEDNIIHLTDEQATKEQIELVLGDELRRSVGEEDRVFIYFAGHGQTEDLPDGNQEGYIVPVDGDRSNLFSTCISMTTVRQFSKRMAAKHVFYAIDACYSGLALVRAGELNPKDRQYLQKIARYPSRQLVTAGSAGEQVIERGGHGAFTSALLVAIDGSADRYPPFGVLTGSELGHYLRPVVSVETNNEQTPQFGRLSAGEGEFMFVLPELEATPEPAAPPPPPAMAFGHLQVNVNATGSRVYVSGLYRGEAGPRAPLNLQDVSLGEVEVRVEAGGHKSVAKRVALKSNQWTQAVFELPVIPISAPPSPKAPASKPKPPEQEQQQQAVVKPPVSSEVGELGEMVYVSDFGFYIDTYEVTNAQYAEFLNARGNRSEGGVTWLDVDDEGALIEQRDERFVSRSGYGDHPVAGVSWYGAKAYCEWAGRRLPMEEEWQQACQGADGRKYPWGDSVGSDRANVDGSQDGYEKISPVGSFPSGASPCGAMDMAGNVWEWTSSPYGSGGDYRVLRGGSWTNVSFVVQCANRSRGAPDDRNNAVGFRCAR